MELEPTTETNKKIFKIVAISDTHGRNDQIQELIDNNESGDIFIHGGDFTRYGRQEHFEEFVSLLGKLKFRHKIIIAGNHEVSLDANMDPKNRQKKLEKYPCKYSKDELIKMIQKQAIYLEHQYVQIEGIRIFGSPYSKKYGRSAFQYENKFQQLVWKDLPEVDILITHCPPYGIMDRADSGKNGGSQSLRSKVFEIKPKIHFFGHIHEGKGSKVRNGIQFYNLSKQLVRVEMEF